MVCSHIAQIGQFALNAKRQKSSSWKRLPALSSADPRVLPAEDHLINSNWGHLEANAT